MRHYFNRRSRGARKTFTPSIQHSPSSIGNAPAFQVGLLHVLAKSGLLAGASMTSDRTGVEDRTVEIDNGKHVGQMTIDLVIQPSTDTSGYYEYLFVKYQRQTSVPAWGTDPVPTSAGVLTDGLQREARSLSPGWVVKFGIIPCTSETVVTRTIKVNWKKFKMDKVRDGDFFCMLMYNRQSSATKYDFHVRYKTY